MLAWCSKNTFHPGRAMREMFGSSSITCLFWPPERRGYCALRSIRLAAGEGKRACPLGQDLCRPAGTGLILWFLFGPPARRAARGPVRGCRPSEAPSALPPDDPAGFSISHRPSKPHQHSLRPILLGFPTSVSPRGLRAFCCGSFPRCARVISLRAAQCHRPISLCSGNGCASAHQGRAIASTN